jgi:hypothetical protein
MKAEQKFGLYCDLDTSKVNVWLLYRAICPYLARQLSVFNDRQLVTGLPETMVGGL